MKFLSNDGEHLAVACYDCDWIYVLPQKIHGNPFRSYIVQSRVDAHKWMHKDKVHDCVFPSISRKIKNSFLKRPGPSRQGRHRMQCGEVAGV